MTTHVGLVIDRSGSMGSVAQEACGSLNTFIKSLKKVPGKKLITAIQFDNEIETIHTKVKRKEIPEFVAGENYHPRGMTALYDAIGTMITALDKEENVVICVITDGFENASHEYKHDTINALVTKKKEAGWDFQFLAAGIDGKPFADSIGIAKTVNVSKDAAGMRNMSASMTANYTSYVQDGGAAGLKSKGTYDPDGDSAQS